jgi:ribosome-associated heat shock protein Hsp15
MDTVRIDKWLWAARFFKTRSLATDAVEGGRVKLAGERVKPARNIKPGDMLRVENESGTYELHVLALSDKRGPASVAQGLYQETEPSRIERERLAQERRYYQEPATGIRGRPTKRDRRLLDRG